MPAGKEKLKSQLKEVQNFYYTRDQFNHPNIIVGEHTYGRPVVRFLPNSRAKLIIGRYCSISSDSQFLMGGNYRLDWVSTYPFKNLKSVWPKAQHAEGQTPVSKGDIVIGNDVWIAADAMILSGVTIGDGAVVGARSVVSNNVAPYSIVAGNPAREVKKRFDLETIDFLLEIKWWDWPDEKVAEVADILSGPNVMKLKEYV